MPHSGGAQSKLVQLKRITREGLGGKAPAEGHEGLGPKPHVDMHYIFFFKP